MFNEFSKCYFYVTFIQEDAIVKTCHLIELEETYPNITHVHFVHTISSISSSFNN